MADKENPFYYLANDVVGYVQENLKELPEDDEYDFDGWELSDLIRSWPGSEVIELDDFSGSQLGRQQLRQAAMLVANEENPPAAKWHDEEDEDIEYDTISVAEFAKAIESAMWTALDSARDYWAADEAKGEDEDDEDY